MASTSQLVQEEILRNMPEYESHTTVGIRKGVKQVMSHSPTNSETSIFSTVDCYSFSSRSDASSFAKEDTNAASVTSSIENIPSGARLMTEESSTATKGSGYFEFSFLDEKVRNGEGNSVMMAEAGGENRELALVKVPSENRIQDDSFETFPVWTDRTKDIHTCHNPCFEDEPHLRTSRRKKFTRGLGSVLTKHLTLSPGPTFRRSSYDKFRARVALDNPSPSSENLVTGTPGRNFDSIRSGYMSSPGYMRRNMSSPRISFARGKTKVYGTSPKRGGCLGITSKAAEESLEDDSKGPLYFATEESVHGGKLLCLPSPRLSFGSGKTGSSQQSNSTISMAIPSNTIHGHLHCIVRDELPSFTLLVDGLDEVLVAKAVHLENLECLDNVEYMFYSCKPKGRPKGNWKRWVWKHRGIPDVVAKMVISSSAGDGDDTVDIECVVSDGKGSLSPRLSFSTWETGLSPHSSCKSPFYSFPSPFSIVSPSPGRLLSSRTPRRERGVFQDTWSDTEFPEAKEQSEFAAVIVRVNNDGTSVHSKWFTKPAKRRNSYYRRLSLPGMFQVTETKENQDTLPLRQGGKSSKLRELMGVGPDFGRQADHTDVTVVLPAGNHGMPLYGIGGPQPLIDRWRSGGRCDCGSWDLGCGLSVLESGHRKPPYDDQRGGLKMFMQGNKKNGSIMNIGPSDDGIFPVWFKAPMSYIQAFATMVAIVYSRGPDTCNEYPKEPLKESSTKPPRVPLKTLTSQSRVALSGYCSPPPPCLLDRL